MTEDNHNDQEDNNPPVRKAKTGAWWKSVPRQLAEVFAPTATAESIPTPSETPAQPVIDVPPVHDTSRQELPQPMA